ncbi:TetR family transcriptional regulator [Mycetocola tolaasinivorans]|uniref:TetR family transcriptional regulator n=1 Tax=Mycetocola tolaasinivorans TaxID=76635 RepID=A0A3L7AAV5_9MICO|nr:TetR/AcrR family transcriptional regulator [Mycetocola tolaasinivorans]RLP76472.1 TetR family transcriptional regulator [Mycetocola tolaasinivorans]
MGRTSDGRERLLAGAARLLGQRPYNAIGVAEICAAAGVHKGSFYYYFDSKQALALAVIDAHWEVQGAQWTEILNAPVGVRERLHNLFTLTAEVQTDSLRETGAITGCLFGNLALEMRGQDDEIRDRLQEIFEQQLDLVEAALLEATAAGELPVTLVPARDSARALVAQLEGLVLFAKVFNDPAQLDRLWMTSMNILGTIDASSMTSAPTDGVSASH